MKIYSYPNKEEWPAICRRPDAGGADIAEKVREIVEAVKRDGDPAVLEFTRRFDGCDAGLTVSGEEIRAAAALVPEDLRDAIETAGRNIENFHRAQEPAPLKVETFPGVVCGTRSVPIEKVGIYAPGGTAPLFSSVMMLAIPASIAGCREIVLCTPPDREGRIDPVLLYTAGRFGVTKVIRAGGAQAIAALAYGTATVPKVDKIFGPGNRFVTEAKMLVSSGGVAVDMPAGPSEVAVVADADANPAFVAADLLAQAEHGTDSQVVLITDSDEIVSTVSDEIESQLAVLPRKEIAAAALGNSFAVVLAGMEEAIDFANEYAAEHLILATGDAEELAAKVTNAGSVFIGEFSCESAGDYASGTNHTLPTNGFARAFSGVSLSSFRKQITYQTITAEGILGLGPVIERLAEAEGLAAHRNAVTVRLEAARGRASRAAGGAEDAD